MNKKWVSMLLLTFVIVSSLACKQLFQTREGIDSSDISNYPFDSSGNPIFPKDKNGNPILPVPFGFYKTTAGEILPIPDGSYVDADGKLQAIPNGYYTDNDGKLVPYLVNLTDSNNKGAKYGKDSQYHYAKDNIDLNYHSSVEEINASTDAYGLVSGTAYVYDKDGKQATMSPIGDITNPTYFVPGAYKYGSSSYVPTYEDTVYLSQTSGLSQVGVYRNIPSKNGDFRPDISPPPKYTGPAKADW